LPRAAQTKPDYFNEPMYVTATEGPLQNVASEIGPEFKSFRDMV
jgi:hypothetical protein